MSMTLLDRLKSVVHSHGAGYLVLLDPDSYTLSELVQTAKLCEANGADGLLVGGSTAFGNQFDEAVQSINDAADIPVILFPGSARQVSAHADGMLLMSLISGRNPQYLIGEQVMAAPAIRALGVETIPTGYMLVESGHTTSVEFVSNTKPLPRDKPKLAAAHAMAAEMLGMQLVYLEAGSGAQYPVPETLVAAVRSAVAIPLIVGGGITDPTTARTLVAAGASFIVTGTAVEKSPEPELMRRFANAIHKHAD